MQASEFYSVSIPVQRSSLARFSQKAQRKQDIKTCALKVTFCKMPSLTSNRVKWMCKNVEWIIEPFKLWIGSHLNYSCCSRAWTAWWMFIILDSCLTRKHNFALLNFIKYFKSNSFPLHFLKSEIFLAFKYRLGVCTKVLGWLFLACC